MTDPLVTALRQRRQQRGLSRTVLAGLAGVALPQISRVEEGDHSPTLRTLRALAEALECDLVLTPKPNVRVSLPGGIWPAP